MPDVDTDIDGTGGAVDAAHSESDSHGNGASDADPNNDA